MQPIIDSLQLKKIEELLAFCFQADQLRRFMARLYGEHFVRQLPGESVSPAELTFRAVEQLNRNGQIDEDLFANLAAERPQLRAQITEVCSSVGIRLSERALTRAAETPPTLPDAVLQDVYEDLKQQQRRVREFLSGPMAKVNGARLLGPRGKNELSSAAQECSAWVSANVRYLTIPEVRQAVELLRSTAPFSPLASEIELLISLFAGDKWLLATRTLEEFASLGMPQLFRLAKQLIESSPDDRKRSRR